MGTSVTPEVIDTAAQWPIGFIILIIMLFIVLLTGKQLLQKLFKYNTNSAILASSPGHLSYIIGMSLDNRANVQQVTLVQSIRVLALTLLVPVFFQIFGGREFSKLQSNVELLAYHNLIFIFLGSIICGWCLKKMNIPAAYLLGGMFVSSLSHLSNLTPGHLPEWLSIPAFLIMGTLIGTRFNSITYTTFQKGLIAGIMITINAVLFTIIAAFIASWFVDVPITQILIAFAPGGLESMAALAILLNVEPSFVAAHHVMRLLLLTFLVPSLLKIYETNEGTIDE